jgi:hypothetical protein
MQNGSATNLCIENIEILPSVLKILNNDVTSAQYSSFKNPLRHHVQTLLRTHCLAMNHTTLIDPMGNEILLTRVTASKKSKTYCGVY